MLGLPCWIMQMFMFSIQCCISTLNASSTRLWSPPSCFEFEPLQKAWKENWIDTGEKPPSRPNWPALVPCTDMGRQCHQCGSIPTISYFRWPLAKAQTSMWNDLTSLVVGWEVGNDYTSAILSVLPGWPCLLWGEVTFSRLGAAQGTQETQGLLMSQIEVVFPRKLPARIYSPCRLMKPHPAHHLVCVGMNCVGNMQNTILNAPEQVVLALVVVLIMQGFLLKLNTLLCVVLALLEVFARSVRIKSSNGICDRSPLHWPPMETLSQRMF